MKQKLIVALVASALELYAAQAGAAGCPALGNATRVSAATPVSTGPLNITNGFPEYVTDSNGISVQRCLDPVYCFASPVIASDPFSVQIGSGIEAFYWSATATVDDPAGNRVLTYQAAAETAFLQFGPNDAPIDGSQFAFLRLRFTIGVPADGTYTVAHPYGVDTFVVNGATGHRDVFFTIDKGLSPNQPNVQGEVGPFMYTDPNPALGQVTPAGFLGDGGVAAAPVFAQGGPCSNEVVITGVDAFGAPVDFGPAGSPTYALSTQLFGIQGALYDKRVQTPLSSARVTYGRPAVGSGQIDTFGVSTPKAALSVVDGPAATLVAGSGRISSPVTLDHSEFTDATGVVSQGTNSASVAVANPSAVPAILSVTADDTVSTLAADPTARKFDPTTLNLHLVDFVDITQADYDPGTSVLSVAATSADKLKPPTLTLTDFGAFTAGATTKLVTTVAPPGEVTVISSAGGSAKAKVRVINAVAPDAPTLLKATAHTGRSITLTWQDNAANETSFVIYRVDTSTAGVDTLVNVGTAGTATGKGPVSFTVSGLAPSTTYTFVVTAKNSVGESAPTNKATDTTSSLPLAPSGVTSALSTKTSRAIDLSWTDNATDETGFEVYRSTAPITAANVGSATLVKTVGANTAAAPVTSIDTGLAAGPTYYYAVSTVRGTDKSDPVSAGALPTPTAVPANPTSVTMTNKTSLAPAVTVSWKDNATNEQEFIVSRATATVGGGGRITAGTFSEVKRVPAFTGTGTTSTDDTTVAGGATYVYQVSARNWVSATTAAQSAATVVTNAALGITAVTPGTTAGSISSVTWNNIANETGYKVEYATDGVTFANAVTPRTANTTTSGAFTVPTTTPGVTYTFKVTAVNATDSTSATTTLAGLLAPTNLSVPAGNRTVTISWTDNSGVETGYVLERCTGTAAACAATNATWTPVTLSKYTNNQTGTGTRTADITGVTPTSTYRLSARWGTASSDYIKFTR